MYDGFTNINFIQTINIKEVAMPGHLHFHQNDQRKVSKSSPLLVQ